MRRVISKIESVPRTEITLRARSRHRAIFQLRRYRLVRMSDKKTRAKYHIRRYKHNNYLRTRRASRLTVLYTASRLVIILFVSFTALCWQFQKLPRVITRDLTVCNENALDRDELLALFSRLSSRWNLTKGRRHIVDFCTSYHLIITI